MLEACRSRGSAGFGVGNGNDGLGELFSSACSLLSQPVIPLGLAEHAFGYRWQEQTDWPARDRW